MSERVRVLRIIARLNVGGPALHATLLTERLDPCRYDSLLVAGTEEPSEGNYLALQGRRLDQLVMLPGLGREIRGWQDLRAVGQLARLMRRVRPTIVHTHTAKAGAVGRVAALLARVPVVVHTYHGHVLRGYFPPAKTRLFVAIERALARWTDRLLAVSESVRAEILGLGIGCPERFTVVPLGLDLDRFVGADTRRGEFRAELGCRADVPLVGIVARLVPIKAHELYLEAAAAVRRAVPESRFILVGDGERRPALANLARSLGLENCVHFLGWRNDLDRIYADLDLVVLCSRNEGSPVSLIEGMAAGRAVVATRVGGIPDLVEHDVTGYLTAPDDPAELARAIVDLLQDANRRAAFGEAGRKRVYPAFSAERLLANVDRLYGELVTPLGSARR